MRWKEISYRLKYKRQEILEDICSKINLNKPQLKIHCRNSYERKFIHESANENKLIHFTVETTNIENTHKIVDESGGMHGVYRIRYEKIPRFIKAVVLIHPNEIGRILDFYFDLYLDISNNIILPFLF